MAKETPAQTQARHEREIAELRAAQKQSDKEITELRAAQKRSAKKIAGLRRQLREKKEKETKNLAERYGLTGRDVKYLDELVRPEAEHAPERSAEDDYEDAMKKNGVAGVMLDRFHPRARELKSGVRIDRIGINDKVVMPVRIEETLRPEKVREFFCAHLGRFEEAFPFFVGDRKIMGVIIFAACVKETDEDGKLEDPVQLALDAGLILLQSTSANNLKPIHSVDDVVAPPDNN